LKGTVEKAVKRTPNEEPPSGTASAFRAPDTRRGALDVRGARRYPGGSGTGSGSAPVFSLTTTLNCRWFRYRAVLFVVLPPAVE